MIYDLELEYRKSSAVMAVRNEVVPRRLGEKDLSVLVRSYVESMAGAEFSLGQFETAIKETRLATRILDERSFKVAGQQAYEATVEIAQVDQVRLSGEQAVSQIRRVVLIRPPYTYLQALHQRHRPPRCLPRHGARLCHCRVLLRSCGFRQTHW